MIGCSCASCVIGDALVAVQSERNAGLSRLRAPVVVELELDAEVLAFQELDDRLKIVPVLA